MIEWDSCKVCSLPSQAFRDGFLFSGGLLFGDSIPIFSKLVKHVSGNALDDYVTGLENEVKKYLSGTPNYGKAAKRMYNVFRLTGKYAEAVYLRELFDEPTTMLYQAGALIRTIDESFQPGSRIELETIIDQTDQLILSVAEVLEGEAETEIMRLLFRLRNQLDEDAKRGQLSPQANAARDEVVNLVNNFFHEKLIGVPTIKGYIEQLQE